MRTFSRLKEAKIKIPIKIVINHPVLLYALVYEYWHICNLLDTWHWNLLSSLQEPLPKAATFLLCHPGLRSIWGYGSLLFDGGIPYPVCHVNLETLVPSASFYTSPIASPSKLPSLHSTEGVRMFQNRNSKSADGPFQSTEVRVEADTSQYTFLCSVHIFLEDHFSWKIS